MYFNFFKIISKSKKSKEVELLVQENDILQKKLASQEDDFRLQNETIMKELNYYITKNEELEKNLERLYYLLYLVFFAKKIIFLLKSFNKQQQVKKW